nr:unnamed protein product [Haemonchus contortus]
MNLIYVIHRVERRSTRTSTRGRRRLATKDGSPALSFSLEGESMVTTNTSFMISVSVFHCIVLHQTPIRCLVTC